MIQHLPFQCTQILRLSSRQLGRGDQASIYQSLACPPSRLQECIWTSRDMKNAKEGRTDGPGGHMHIFQLHGSLHLRCSLQYMGGTTRVSGTSCLALSLHPVFCCSLRPYPWSNANKMRRLQSDRLVHLIQQTGRGRVLGHKRVLALTVRT
jgi:hypothetical protein